MSFFKPAQPRLLEAACRSDAGKKRKNNEDNFCFNGVCMDSDSPEAPRTLVLRPRDSASQDGSFFAVFDGMGGGDYGEVASYTAAKSACGFFVEQDRVEPHDVTESLREYCGEANGEVFRAGSSLGTEQMGSTLAALYFLDGQAWVCNLGDSRCFLAREGRLEQLSVDHTDAEEMNAHHITGRKPYLTQYLGIDPSELRIEPHVKRVRLSEGDIFLLCSDGLTDMVPLPEIEQILLARSAPREAVEALVGAALEAGGRDNITVMVFQC